MQPCGVFSALASSAAFAKDPASQIVSCRRLSRSSANENNRALGQESVCLVLSAG
jgi:hypothetical protein